VLLAESGAIELLPIDLHNLCRLAVSEAVDLGEMQIFEGALPPPHVAARALAQLHLGTSAHWCVPFLIVSRTIVLGGCGFKTAPINGSVEIGYGVAESQRGRGIATAAVAQLLQIASSSGLVQIVVAQVIPDNAASSKVVSRLGFSKGQSLVDHDGETVVQWSFPVAT
jgi:[ribosomal protein S5]-alanine N-acetyltransferase